MALPEIKTRKDQHLDVLKGYMPSADAFSIADNHEHLHGTYHPYGDKRLHIWRIMAVCMFDVYNGQVEDYEECKPWEYNPLGSKLPIPKNGDYAVIADITEEEFANGKWAPIEKSFQQYVLGDFISAYGIDTSVSPAKQIEIAERQKAHDAHVDRLTNGISYEEAKEIAEGGECDYYSTLWYRNAANDEVYRMYHAMADHHPRGLWVVYLDYYMVRKRDSEGIWQDVAEPRKHTMCLTFGESITQLHTF